MNFSTEFAKQKEAFEKYLASYIGALPVEDLAGIKKLHESMSYSSLGQGKRFRPLLTLLTIEAFGENIESGLPFATAVEFIHTYSLIHDDLPVMDNDDERRGRPTNHKLFGDAMALLAGDALLTEAFAAIASGYSEDPATAVELVTILSRAAGPLARWMRRRSTTRSETIGAMGERDCTACAAAAALDQTGAGMAPSAIQASQSGEKGPFHHESPPRSPTPGPRRRL